jgi:hypothetical protein
VEPCYPPFDIESWRSIEAIEGRVATHEDVNLCVAVFAAGEGQSEFVVTPGLPALALLTNDDGTKTKVVIVQIEKQIGGDMTVVGYVLPSGGNGLATPSDLDFVEYSK